MIGKSKRIKHRTLADNGATIEVINESKAEKIIEVSNGNLKMEKGRKFIVENAGAEDITYDGRNIIIPTQKPLYKNIYVPLKYYITPVDLPYDIIIGRHGLKTLGYQMALVSDDNKTAYVHKRENVIYDVNKNSNVWEK